MQAKKQLGHQNYNIIQIIRIFYIKLNSKQNQIQ